MSRPLYQWRTLTREQQVETLFNRLQKAHPWHSPPHRPSFNTHQYHITAACYEHAPHIGYSPERMDCFSQSLLGACSPHADQIFAWCLLPNHYHLLVRASDVISLLANLGQLHGRTSFMWNGEESTRGRKVFYRCVERAMRSERHFYATLNYVHHNPVHHRYVQRWDQWPWGSAAEFLAQTPRDEAKHIWHSFPIRDYGKGWDDPEM